MLPFDIIEYYEWLGDIDSDGGLITQADLDPTDTPLHTFEGWLAIPCVKGSIIWSKETLDWHADQMTGLGKAEYENGPPCGIIQEICHPVIKTPSGGAVIKCNDCLGAGYTHAKTPCGAEVAIIPNITLSMEIPSKPTAKKVLPFNPDSLANTVDHIGASTVKADLYGPLMEDGSFH